MVQRHRANYIALLIGLFLQAICVTWVAAGDALPAPPSDAELARVKEIFRTRCYECHGGSAVNAGVNVLNRDQLVAQNKIVPGNTDRSRLIQVLTVQDGTGMPPEGQPRLPAEDIETIRRWVANGAAELPGDALTLSDETPAGPDSMFDAEYTLRNILVHVQSLPTQDRSFMRYFSVQHLLAGGATRQELDLHHDALAKAINHLSLATEIVQLETIDVPHNTLFAVDIRRLGWNLQPFELIVDGQKLASAINIFDLALLEYPYGVMYPDSECWEPLVREYLIPASLVRPVPYVRADWFCSVTTQPPLYEDFLRLPHELSQLEQRLGVDIAADLAEGRVQRAGLTVSGPSRNNRVVERHASQHGVFWGSADFRSSKGRDNIFLDPIHLQPAGGEFVFSLPNGLFGYFLANAIGRRLSSAPTDIVTDKFAEDKTVRNGLSCMRCHEHGVKRFTDTVRPAVAAFPGGAGFSKREVLELYPPQSRMDADLDTDEARFHAALELALSNPQETEPLTPVSKRFLEAPIHLQSAAAELGLPPAGLQQLFRTPRFSSLGVVALGSGTGVVRRDAWEGYFGQLIEDLGQGVPVLPLDALTTRDFPPNNPPFEVGLTTNSKTNVFAAGDELVLFVNNPSDTNLFIELIGHGDRGEQVILVPGGTLLKAGQKLRFPAEEAIVVQPGVGQEQITLFASTHKFPAGRLLRMRSDLAEGSLYPIADRVVHSFYSVDAQDRKVGRTFDPARLVKKTIDIETK